MALAGDDRPIGAAAIEKPAPARDVASDGAHPARACSLMTCAYGTNSVARASFTPEAATSSRMASTSIGMPPNLLKRNRPGQRRASLDGE